MQELKIGCTGDAAFTGVFLENFRSGRPVISAALEALIRDHHYFLINLEGPVTDLKSEKKWPVLNPPGTLSRLRSSGVNACLLANNHMGDAGPGGLDDTLTALRGSELHFCGAGINASEASKPLLLSENGIRVAVFNTTDDEGFAAGHKSAGVACFSPEELSKAVMLVQQDVHHVLVVYHGGEEYTSWPSPPKRKLLRKFAAIPGVRAVISHHPHHLQGVERQGNCLVFHSLGNFFMDLPQHRERPGTERGCILRLVFSDIELKYSLIPITSDRHSGMVSPGGFDINAEMEALSDFSDYPRKWAAAAALYRRAAGQGSEAPVSEIHKPLSAKLFSPSSWHRLWQVISDKYLRSVYVGSLKYKYFYRNKS